MMHGPINIKFQKYFDFNNINLFFVFSAINIPNSLSQLQKSYKEKQQTVMVINYAPTIILVHELHLLLDTIIQTLALSDWRQSGKKTVGISPYAREF